MTDELDRAKRGWGLAYDGLSQAETRRRVRALSAIVGRIARDGSVTPSALAADLGIEVAEARDLFLALGSMGTELDAGGNMVGLALTAKPTPHAIRIPGRGLLYAWCALDTLFIPGLLGQPAAIESRCPVSGERVRLSVVPEGVREYEPEGAVLTVFVPDRSGSLQTGPASPT